MEFRQSQVEDLDQVVRIAEDAKAFLRASGVNQWQRGTYPDRTLFASVCDLAASRDVGRVRVDTHPDNRAMRTALEKAGFVACGELLLDRCEEAGDPRVGYERILR